MSLTAMFLVILLIQTLLISSFQERHMSDFCLSYPFSY